MKISPQMKREMEAIQMCFTRRILRILWTELVSKEDYRSVKVKL